MVGAAYNTILYFAGGLSIFYFITLIFECCVFFTYHQEGKICGSSIAICNINNYNFRLDDGKSYNWFTCASNSLL